MRCQKITAQTQALSEKFYQTKEYFPIEINFGDKETIKITKRPRKTTTEIIDLYANTIHIGMFVGIEKKGNELHFGPTGLNKSHVYRNILDYTFVRLLEYYGLNDLEKISIDVPEDPEFKTFVLKCGFIPKDAELILEITDSSVQKLMETIEAFSLEIKSQVGQLHNIIQLNLENPTESQITEMVDIIVEKIKNMDPLGKEFWDNRKIMQLNYYLTTAVLNDSQIVNGEFLEMTIKTIVASLDTFNREPYLEELFIALDGGTPFKMDYIQKMIDQLRPLVPEEIKNLPKDHLREWVQKNLPGWILSDKIENKTRTDSVAAAQLKLEDFGPELKEKAKLVVNNLIAHYNGDKIFFGVNNRF
ncbi:MAG: hypothetical protein ACTSRK_05140 [Promethearchaeota archaeon]